ncbi:MAG: hypothetical protein ACE5J3_06000, partial [Methanosarcinales archaeon]
VAILFKVPRTQPKCLFCLNKRLQKFLGFFMIMTKSRKICNFSRSAHFPKYKTISINPARIFDW